MFVCAEDDADGVFVCKTKKLSLYGQQIMYLCRCMIKQRWLTIPACGTDPVSDREGF